MQTFGFGGEGDVVVQNLTPSEEHEGHGVVVVSKVAVHSRGH